jgi:site-specific DNA-adenine methylase
MFKCFFSYYGSKAKIAKYYSKPKFGKIVEPFCGAANYSVLHYQNEVYLTDLNKDIVDTWEFLINANINDILKLPKFEKGLDLRKLNLSNGERKFCGFWVNRGMTSACNIVSNFAMQNSNGAEYFEIKKKEVSENLFRIKHWKIKETSYENLLDDFKATWFIDPPYFDGGKHYKFNKIVYEKLAEWCKTRLGLIIVCENTSATWLNFEHLIFNQGSVNNKSEGCFIKEM